MIRSGNRIKKIGRMVKTAAQIGNAAVPVTIKAIGVIMNTMLSRLRSKKNRS